METLISTEGNITTVKLIGRLDTASSQEVSNALDPVIKNATGTIVMDCSQMSYISSSGLRIFLTIRKAAAEQGGNVIVKSISNDIRSVFMMTGFTNLFQIED